MNNSIREKLKFIKKNKNIFFALVISIPIFTSFLYFYSIGRKRFFVRADVVVRTASNNNNSFDISNIIGSGNQSSREDSLYLQTYLESPQVLRDLGKIMNFEELYKKKGLDFYAGLASEASAEKKYNFFRKQVSIGFNERSGVLRIRSLAYDPETSLNLNLFLVDQAEKFVNKLNQSIYKEQLKFLNSQVKKNVEKLNIANKELSQFQQSNKILDVKNEAMLTTNLISELESQLVKLKVELASIKRQFIDQSSPEIEILQDQIEELKKQINIERNLLVNPKGKNFSEQLIKMSKLKTNQKFANDLYIASLKSAEKAAVDSIQQQRFLAIISEPQLPEDEWRYWRHRGFLTLLTIFFITASLLKFLMGMADSHNN